MPREGIMLAKPMSIPHIEHWPYIILQPKLDGIRCRAKISRSEKGIEVMLLSSQKNVFHSVPHINLELARLISDGIIFLKTETEIELDGEIYKHGVPLQYLSGIARRTTSLHPDYNKMEYHIFDIVNGDAQLIRSLTVDRLHQLFLGNPKVQAVKSTIIDTVAEIPEYLSEKMTEGFEGIIARHPDALYERKRVSTMFKLKPRKQDEYQIIGVTEEISIHGEPKNALGAFVCLKDNQIFHVGTGPALTRENREHFWKLREELETGRYNAVIKYQYLTADRQVPYVPVVVAVVER